jgi:phosphoserine phosphatase
MTSQEISPGLVIQGITLPLKLSDFKLIAFDMDSTLINIECIDEIADFKDSLRRRVALLKGVTVSDLEAVYTQRLQLNPGAADLIKACKAAVKYRSL